MAVALDMGALSCRPVNTALQSDTYLQHTFVTLDFDVSYYLKNILYQVITSQVSGQLNPGRVVLSILK